MTITDRMRFIIEEANTGVILNRDLEVLEPKAGGQLSGPGTIQFGVSPFANPILDWKKNGQWVHLEMEFNGVKKIMLSTIVKSAIPDPESGIMQIETYGFSDYPKGKPWLENYNDIAVDPFEVVQRVWVHVQSFANAQLGVEVYPASSGTQMLPGYGFDGTTLTFDFFALFIRAVDFVDCADQINGLARDIPFDYLEKSWWSEDRTEISKQLLLGYSSSGPGIGVRQEHLAFVVGENVLKTELADEKDIEPVTDVIIRSWQPGSVYNSQLGNADDTQFRETILEEDAKINSTERAAAWAAKKLQKRTVPKYWKKIVVDPDHSNAPFGSYELGDLIFVRGTNPWYGEIALWHRITSWAYDEQNRRVELGLKVEGAFNYDPIDYDPDYEEPPRPNLLHNGFFGDSLNYWTRASGSWIRVSNKGFATAGCVRIDADGTSKVLRSEKIGVAPGDELDLTAYVTWEDVTSASGEGFVLRVTTTFMGGTPVDHDIDSIDHPVGLHAWQRLEGTYTIPSGVDEIAVKLVCTANVTGGTAYWDDVVMIEAE